MSDMCICSLVKLASQGNCSAAVQLLRIKPEISPTVQSIASPTDEEIELAFHRLYQIAFRAA